MRSGELDREIGLLESGQNETIDRVKKETKEAAAPLHDKKAALELSLKEFCEANRGEFAKVKTKALTFGSVGFRISTKVMVKRVADTLQALKGPGAFRLHQGQGGAGQGGDEEPLYGDPGGGRGQPEDGERLRV